MYRVGYDSYDSFLFSFLLLYLAVIYYDVEFYLVFRYLFELLYEHIVRFIQGITLSNCSLLGVVLLAKCREGVARCMNREALPSRD